MEKRCISEGLHFNARVFFENSVIEREEEKIESLQNLPSHRLIRSFDRSENSIYCGSLFNGSFLVFFSSCCGLRRKGGKSSDNVASRPDS